MGTLINVELWQTDADKAEQCIETVFDEMHRIDELMSPYIEKSELSRINREAAQHPVATSRELFDLIIRAQQISELSGGAFDITYASVGFMYDYREHKHPSETEIKSHLGAINYHHVILDAEKQTIRFSQPGVKIDLGGIAKGYAVDNSIEKLKQCGIGNALVSAGGDTRILGDRGDRPWMIGIQHPRDMGKLALKMPLSNTAISTSGDYERFFIEEGKRYHHIISPQSGKSATASISASVIGPDATTTDALSTTLFILGPEKGIKLIETVPGFDAVIIGNTGKVYYSSGLQSPVSP